jgi:hypothetical protein
LRAVLNAREALLAMMLVLRPAAYDFNILRRAHLRADIAADAIVVNRKILIHIRYFCYEIAVDKFEYPRQFIYPIAFFHFY